MEISAFIKGEREESRKERLEFKAELQQQQAAAKEEREEAKVERQEMVAKLQQQQAAAKAEFEAKQTETDQLREAAHESQLREVDRESKLREQAVKLREQQVAALQARLESLLAAKLLADEELHAVEDVIADSEEAADGDRVPALLALSSKMASDRAFARQLQRKKWL